MSQTSFIRNIANESSRIMPKGTIVWLYGSRARGEERPDSDWDILVLMAKEQIEDDDFDKYGYPLIEYGWHFNADLSPQLYTKKEWEAMSITPFYQNVERDKQVVYES